MQYGIINKATKLFFAGHKNNEPTWTSDKRLAWSDKKMFAQAQASLFHAMGVKVQQNPVSI